MRAGQLDTSIEIQSYIAGGVDDYGTPIEGWAPVAQLRAQVIQSGTDEYLRGYGEGAERVIIFRIRYRDGITTDCRVLYQASPFNIREVKQMGRRKGLELRCEEVRA